MTKIAKKKTKKSIRLRSIVGPFYGMFEKIPSTTSQSSNDKTFSTTTTATATTTTIATATVDRGATYDMTFSLYQQCETIDSLSCRPDDETNDLISILNRETTNTVTTTSDTITFTNNDEPLTEAEADKSNCMSIFGDDHRKIKREDEEVSFIDLTGEKVSAKEKNSYFMCIRRREIINHEETHKNKGIDEVHSFPPISNSTSDSGFYSKMGIIALYQISSECNDLSSDDIQQLLSRGGKTTSSTESKISQAHSLTIIHDINKMNDNIITNKSNLHAIIVNDENRRYLHLTPLIVHGCLLNSQIYNTEYKMSFSSKIEMNIFFENLKTIQRLITTNHDQWSSLLSSPFPTKDNEKLRRKTSKMRKITIRRKSKSGIVLVARRIKPSSPLISEDTDLDDSTDTIGSTVSLCQQHSVPSYTIVDEYNILSSDSSSTSTTVYGRKGKKRKVQSSPLLSSLAEKTLNEISLDSRDLYSSYRDIIFKSANYEVNSENHNLSDYYFVTNDDYYPKKKISDYLFLLLAQMKPGIFTKNDQLNSRNRNNANQIPVGYKGLRCRHCGGMQKGNYFPLTKKNLQATTPVIFNHLLKTCKHVPPFIKNSILRAKVKHKQQISQIECTQVSFFEKLWKRIHQENQDSDQSGNSHQGNYQSNSIDSCFSQCIIPGKNNGPSYSYDCGGEEGVKAVSQILYDLVVVYTRKKNDDSIVEEHFQEEEKQRDDIIVVKKENKKKRKIKRTKKEEDEKRQFRGKESRYLKGQKNVVQDISTDESIDHDFGNVKQFIPPQDVKPFLPEESMCKSVSSQKMDTRKNNVLSFDDIDFDIGMVIEALGDGTSIINNMTLTKSNHINDVIDDEKLYNDVIKTSSFEDNSDISRVAHEWSQQSHLKKNSNNQHGKDITNDDEDLNVITQMDDSSLQLLNTQLIPSPPSSLLRKLHQQTDKHGSFYNYYNKPNNDCKKNDGRKVCKSEQQTSTISSTDSIKRTSPFSPLKIIIDSPICSNNNKSKSSNTLQPSPLIARKPSSSRNKKTNLVNFENNNKFSGRIPNEKNHVGDVVMLKQREPMVHLTLPHYLESSGFDQKLERNRIQNFMNKNHEPKCVKKDTQILKKDENKYANDSNHNSSSTNECNYDSSLSSLTKKCNSSFPVSRVTNSDSILDDFVLHERKEESKINKPH